MDRIYNPDSTLIQDQTGMKYIQYWLRQATLDNAGYWTGNKFIGKIYKLLGIAKKDELHL